MSSPVNHENLIFASSPGNLCDVKTAYLQAISVLRALMNYSINSDDNTLQPEFLKDIAASFPWFYGVATNENDAYAIEFPEETHPQYSSTADLVGVPIFMKVPASNTGASTLAVGTTAAIQIYAGDQALYAGALLANSIAIVMFDGTVYRLLNPEAKSLTSQIKSTGLVALPAKGKVLTITRPSGAVMIRAVMVAQSGVGGGRTEGEVVSLDDVMEDLGDTARSKAFNVSELDESWKVARLRNYGGSDTGNEIINLNDGSIYAISDSQWRIRIDYL
jgi:hypothetical protein